MFVCVCIYIYIYTCMCICVYVCQCVCVYMCVCVYIYIYIYIIANRVSRAGGYSADARSTYRWGNLKYIGGGSFDAAFNQLRASNTSLW